MIRLEGRDPKVDKEAQDEPKIIISGTGRCGTTFMVRLFTYLGFDTGFSIEQIEGAQHEGGPGLEHPIRLARQPQVIKNPRWAFNLDKIRLGWTKFAIKGIIIPVRDPIEVALSRFRRSERGGAGGTITDAGCTDIPSEVQMAKLMVSNFQTASQDKGFKVPIEFIEFKKYTKDPEYLYDKLEFLFEGREITREGFKEAYDKATKLWKKGEF